MRLIDFVYHSTLGLRVMTKKKLARPRPLTRGALLVPLLSELLPLRAPEVLARGPCLTRIQTPTPKRQLPPERRLQPLGCSRILLDSGRARLGPSARLPRRGASFCPGGKAAIAKARIWPSQGQNLALAVLSVPYSLDSGTGSDVSHPSRQPADNLVVVDPPAAFK